jgi:hypothetical protein
VAISFGVYLELVVVTCTVVVLTCFVMCGCVGFCNMGVCVGVGFVRCVSFDNMCTCIYCVLYCLYCIFCVFSFMYVFFCLFGLYCHRVTTQLQLVVVVVVIIIIIIIINPARNLKSPSQLFLFVLRN